MFKTSKRLAAFFAALSLALAAFDIGAYAAQLPETGGGLAGTLIVLHTNDTHGRDLDGAFNDAKIAQIKKDYREAGADVILLSAGDFSQGTPLVNLTEGAQAVSFMNLTGYDAATLGNHEFDWGADRALANAALADFPMVSCNIIGTDGATLFPPSVIIETAHYKVGVIGVETPGTATKVHPDKIKGITFLAGEELFAAARAEVDALKAAGVDYVVVLGHLGEEDELMGNRSMDFIDNVAGVDLFIDGHSHIAIENGVTQGNTLRVSTGSYLDNLGIVTFGKGEPNAALLPGGGYDGEDAYVLAALTEANDDVEARLSETFAKTEAILDGSRAPGVRTQETNLGDFAADAMLWQARAYLGKDKVDFALTNGGGIRETISVGDLTMKTMKTVFPFGNLLTTVDVTGAQLLEALEAATFAVPDSAGAFPQVSGITFTIDASVPWEAGAAYPNGSTYFSPAKAGSRVRNVMVGGEPLNLEKTYVLVTNDFTAAGGDTYGAFADRPRYNTGLALEDALVNYTAEALGGVITAERYGEAAGRITITYPEAGGETVAEPPQAEAVGPAKENPHTGDDGGYAGGLIAVVITLAAAGLLGERLKRTSQL